MRDLACGISEVEAHTISYISNYLELLTALFGFDLAIIECESKHSV